MRLHIVRVVAILLSPFCAALAAPITSFTQLIVFGDSLSDAGNASIASSGLLPGTNYATRTVPGVIFPVGYYTDGSATTPGTPSPTGLWIDQLAAKLGLADPEPALAPGGGTNYAVAGAETGTSTVYDMGNQVADFLAGHSTAPSSALYTFWGGANDVFNGANPKQAADNIEAEIDALAGHGAKYFLWLNIPPLGDTPRGSATAASLNSESAAFNAEWAIDIGALHALGIDVIPVNVDAEFAQILADPSAFGFTNVTSPAQGNASANPNQYLFWDKEHPTTEGDSLVAQLAYNDLTPATTVPEPASMALMGASLVFLFSFWYRRGRNSQVVNSQPAAWAARRRS